MELTWTEKKQLNTGSGNLMEQVGTQTAALFLEDKSGGATAKTESWDGSSWTEVNDLNKARNIKWSGVQTSAAIIKVKPLPSNTKC